jgi:rare lipoprotein A
MIALAACGLALAGAARADEQAAAAPASLNPWQVFVKDLAATHAAKPASPEAVAPPAPAAAQTAPAARPTAHTRAVKLSARPPKTEPDAAPAGATRGLTIVPETTLAPKGDAQVVRASWYGGGERLSAHTANGEVFRPMELTAAHRTLPFGTMLRVTAPATGLTAIVRVNDRGPAASTGYGIDLSRGAATALGIVNKGGQKVTIEVMR